MKSKHEIVKHVLKAAIEYGILVGQGRMDEAEEAKKLILQELLVDDDHQEATDDARSR
jgi:hypothetical protein